MESKKFEKYFRIAHVGGEGVLHSCLKLYAFELSSSPQSDDLAFHNFFAAPHRLESVTLDSCRLFSDCSISHFLVIPNVLFPWKKLSYDTFSLP